MRNETTFDFLFENKRLSLFPIAKKRRLTTTYTSVVTMYYSLSNLQGS